MGITESELDNVKMPGDYTVYLISVESSNLKNDSVVLLEVRKILYNNTSIGYVQRLTGVYNMKGMYTRHFYNPVAKWSNWI